MKKKKFRRKPRSRAKVIFTGYAVAKAHRYGGRRLHFARSALQKILSSAKAREEAVRAKKRAQKNRTRELSAGWIKELRAAGFSYSEINARAQKISVEKRNARNPIQFLPPKGRARKWQRIETTTRGNIVTLVTKRQRDKAIAGIKRRAWEKSVAENLGISIAQARAWKRSIKKQVIREFNRDTPAWKKRWPLKRRLFVAEKMMRELAGVQGSL